MDAKTRLDQIKAQLKIEQPIETTVVKQENTKKLREETAQGIEALAKAMEKNIEEKEKERDVVKDILGKLPDEVDDTYTYDEAGVPRPNLYSNKRRKEIEGRCSEISLEDALINQRIEQTIPIIPDKFVIRLRDTSGKEDSFIKQQIAIETMKKDISSSFVAARMAHYRLTFSLLKVNSKQLPDVQVVGGVDKPIELSDKKAFEEKMEFIMNYPDDILEELDWQFICFKDRIKKISMNDIVNFYKAR